MTRPRYRDENGEPCVDVSVVAIERLFDNRDPAPFRERDLDPDLVEYLQGASEDLASRRFRVVFWLENPCQPGEIQAAYRAHFEYELERLVRARRRQRATGLVGLAIALVTIAALFALAPLAARVIGGWLGDALRETLVISSWVMMWRPVDVLLFDWIPWRRERKTVVRLLAAPIDVRAGKGPSAASG